MRYRYKINNSKNSEAEKGAKYNHEQHELTQH